jgi:hypothetical protein
MTRRGGKKGGKTRAEKPTKEQRFEIARKAAKAQWYEKRAENNLRNPQETGLKVSRYGQNVW